MPDGTGNYWERAGELAKTLRSAAMPLPESKLGCGDSMLTIIAEQVRMERAKGEVA